MPIAGNLWPHICGLVEGARPNELHDPQYPWLPMQCELCRVMTQPIVQVEDEDVEILVDLMRVPAAMAKQMLQKVFTNLCCHHQTRGTILKLLMRLLYLSMVDPDTSGPDGASSSVHPLLFYLSDPCTGLPYPSRGRSRTFSLPACTELSRKKGISAVHCTEHHPANLLEAVQLRGIVCQQTLGSRFPPMHPSGSWTCWSIWLASRPGWLKSSCHCPSRQLQALRYSPNSVLPLYG